MESKTLLLIAILLPLFGAGLVWVVAPLGRGPVRWTSLGTALLTLVSAGLVVFSPEASEGRSFAISDYLWLGDWATGAPDIRFSVGLDGLSIWLFGLSALLMVTCVLVSWESIQDRPALFHGMLLFLASGCLGVFAARDIILFYIFFEFTLIPLFFLIGIWGSEERRYAAVKFFLYTLAGSVLTFLGLLAIVYLNYRASGILTFSIPALTAAFGQQPIEPLALQCAIFLALFAGFAIKVPLFPFHTWLPLAHVQAPTAGSVILAGILLKIGTYGFLRFSIPMLPDASAFFMPLLMWLAVAGIIYGALVALAQADMKRLIAYSSVSHLGYCMLGLFALNPLGVQGGTLQMINHGISTGGLFAMVGMIYDRYHTREIAKLGGLARETPWIAAFMVIFTLSSIGLPGLNGFPGEFMVLLGAFQRGWADGPAVLSTQLTTIAVLAVSGVVLGAWYMLWLVQRVFFGPLRAAHTGGHEQPVRDMRPHEILAVAPLVVFVFWIGLYPHFFLSRMASSLDEATAQARQSMHQLHDVTHALRVPVAHASRVPALPPTSPPEEPSTRVSR